MKTVVGLYDELEDAREAVDELVESGIPRSDISLVARDATGEYGTTLESHDDSDDVGEAAAGGAVGGAVVGGLMGLLVGLGAFAIPGLGPVIAAGPIAATLAGAGIGAATGGLLGALVEWGIPEGEAGYYAEGVRRGGTLLAVRVPETRIEEVVEVMNDYDPVNIERRAEYWRSEYGWESYDATAEPYGPEEIDTFRTGLTNWDADYDEGIDLDMDVDDRDFDLEDDMDIEIVEEDLAVGKRRHERPVRIHTYTVETPVEEDVTLREERVNIERRPVDRPATYASFQEKSIEMTEFEEEAVSEKRARVVEEIHVSKDVDTRTETVHDTVRRTEVDIDRNGGSSQRDSAAWNREMPAWEDLEPTFRSDFDTNYTGGMYAWNQYSPAYRYGYNLGADPNYADSNWTDIEGDVRTRWEENNRGTWDEFSSAIRYGWEQVKDALGVGGYDAGVEDRSDEHMHRR